MLSRVKVVPLQSRSLCIIYTENKDPERQTHIKGEREKGYIRNLLHIKLISKLQRGREYMDGGVTVKVEKNDTVVQMIFFSFYGFTMSLRKTLIFSYKHWLVFGNTGLLLYLNKHL